MTKEKKLEKALTEEKYKCRMVKSKKNWVIKGMLFSTLLISGMSIQTSVYADNWTANNPESIQIENGATSYTLKNGDTLWAVSQVTNIKVEILAEINNINLNSGEQYNLEIGRVIYFDGNHITILNKDGNIVADKVLNDNDKVDSSKPFANQDSDIPKNLVQSDNDGNVVNNQTNINSNQNPTGNSNSKNNQDENNQNGNSNQLNTGNNGEQGNINKPINPSKPEKPTEPSKPVEPEKPVAPEGKEFAVSVIHKDTDGNILEKEAEVKVKKGESYTAKAKEFDDYTLTGQLSQTIKIDSDKEIIFTYRKNEKPNPSEKFDITVKYVDENNQEISDSDTIKIEKGQEYTATAKTIEGYSLVGEVSQSITVEKSETITFKYQKNESPVEKFKITVKYEDEDGNEILSSEIHEIEKGQVFTAQAKDIADYSLIGDNTQSITVTGVETITFKYSRNEEPTIKYFVSVEYKDEDGNLLDSDSPVEIESGKSFTATAKEINGYALVGGNTQTIIVSKSETITFVYKKNETPVAVDKSALENLINSVKNTEQGNYTNESFDNFKSILDNVITVLNNETATQEQVNKAKTDLQNAFDSLTEKEITVDKSELQQLVNSVKETEKGNYTDESYTSFTTSLNNANTVLANENATQTEIDTAKANLQTAFDNLAEKTTGGSLSASEIQIAKNTILREVNNLRAANGLDPVISDDILNRASDVRAKEIEILFDHVRPDGSGIEEAVMEQGAFPGIFGENIASNSAPYKDGEQAGMALFNQWKNSPPHLSLMLTKQMKYIGIGINSSATGIYGVQLMSVMLYDNDTNEPLYPTSKISNDFELKESRVNSQKDSGENTESKTEQITQESVTEEQEEQESETNESYLKETESSDENQTEEVSTVDKEKLKEAYNLALTLDESNYSVHSWSILMFKLADAKFVYDNSDANHSDIENAVLVLQQAINNLV